MWTALVLSLAFAEPKAIDAPDPIDVTLHACTDTPEGGSTHGMVRCMETATASWDAELNVAYKALMGQLTPDNAAALKAAQRAWIAFRDADTAAIMAMRTQQQGTMWQLAATGRVLELTKSRARELRARSEELRISM